MEWIESGGIPKRGLPLGSWPEYGIPGDPEGWSMHTVAHRIDWNQIKQDDDELVELLAIIFQSGILN